MEIQKIDINRSKREHRYDEIRELIGKLTLIEKYIRIRLINGTLQKDEDALHILLDQHRDAVCELGELLSLLKELDRDDEEECIEDDEFDGCVDCDMKAEDDEECKTINSAKDADEEVEQRTARIARQRVEDDEECKDIDLFKDADEDEYDVAEPILITKDVLLAHKFNYHPTLHYCERNYGDINVHIQLACGGGVSFCHIKRRCDSSIESWERDDIELTTIRYVYQLQQALELIGADCGDTF